MERVNLIPKELQVGFKVKAMRFLRAFDVELSLGAWTIFILIAVTAFTIQHFRLGSLNASVKSEQGHIQVASAKLHELSESMKQFEQFKNMVIYQAGLINKRVYYLNAEKSRPKKWAEVFEELRKSLPQNVWLTRVDSEKDTMRIAGGSSDSNRISTFMANLRESPYFANVTFAYTEKSNISDTKITNFEIICQYRLKE